MNGLLVSGTANPAGDDEDEKDEALGRAESWVSEELSDGGIDADVAMALYLKGDGSGLVYLQVARR